MILDWWIVYTVCRLIENPVYLSPYFILKHEYRIRTYVLYYVNYVLHEINGFFNQRKYKQSSMNTMVYGTYKQNKIYLIILKVNQQKINYK